MEDKDLEKAMYRWFDMKYELYSKLDHNDSIYLYYDGDKYADIRIDKNSEYIYFRWSFWLEFSEIFPIDRDEFKKIMFKWVEDTFNLGGLSSIRLTWEINGDLTIPK